MLATVTFPSRNQSRRGQDFQVRDPDHRGDRRRHRDALRATDQDAEQRRCESVRRLEQRRRKVVSKLDRGSEDFCLTSDFGRVLEPEIAGVGRRVANRPTDRKPFDLLIRGNERR
jgi:hypothetical protein